MRRLLLLALVVFVTLTAFAQRKKKQSEIPQQVVVAQFVYVTSFHGDRFDRRATIADRQAINAVEMALQEWHKYRIVNRASDADLMLIVRPGETAAARVGVGLPPIDSTGGRIDPGGTSHKGLDMGADISNVPDDMLLVSITPNEDATAASYIWRRSQRNGLQGRKPSLVEEFRKAVLEAEQAAKKP